MGVGRRGSACQSYNLELILEIRSAKETELAELIDLQCLVFRPTEAEAPTRFWSYLREEPTYQIEQSRVLLDQGRIVAHLRIWDRQIRVRGAQLRVGGIGSVLTHPDFRGRGYARALMRDAEVYMTQAGYDLGMLFTIIGTPFYAGLGWIPIALPTFAFALHSWEDKPHASGRDLQPEQDLTAVMALYDAANAEQTGSELRNPAYWQSGPSRYRELFPQLGVERAGELVGYLNYSCDATDLEVYEVCCMPNDNATCSQLADILMAASQQGQLQTIKGSLPTNHPLLDCLTERIGTQPSIGQHEKTMVKLLDWSKLASKLNQTAISQPPTDESAFWAALFNENSATTPSWMRELPPAQGFFYWDPDVF